MIIKKEFKVFFKIIYSIFFTKVVFRVIVVSISCTIVSHDVCTRNFFLKWHVLQYLYLLRWKLIKEFLGATPPPFHGLGFRRLKNVLFLLVKISGKSATSLKNDGTYVPVVKPSSCSWKCFFFKFSKCYMYQAILTKRTLKKTQNWFYMFLNKSISGFSPFHIRTLACSWMKYCWWNWVASFLPDPHLFEECFCHHRESGCRRMCPKGHFITEYFTRQTFTGEANIYIR